MERLKRLYKKIGGTMNLILLLLFCTVLVFTVYMIRLFETYQMIPDTLVTCFFAAVTGELGVMGWIKSAKERRRERDYALQDMKLNHGEDTHDGTCG